MDDGADCIGGAFLSLRSLRLDSIRAWGRIGREMDADAARAKRYRERAEGLRRAAESLSSNNQQRMLIGIALEYERLAKLLEPGDASFDRLSAVVELKKRDNSN